MKALTTLIFAMAVIHVAGQSSQLGVADALRLSLDDERRAHAFYSAVMERQGAVRPFANIVRSEAVHRQIVLDLMVRHRVTVPEDPYIQRADETREAWAARLGVPGTFRESLVMARDGEKANISLYDKLLQSDLPADVRQGLTKLRTDSKDRHLPAFERALTRRR